MTYATSKSSAARMLAGKGQAITITNRAAGAYDVATGAAAITETTQSGFGVILPISSFKKAGNSNIVEGDRQLLLSPLNAAGADLTAPKVDDQIALADASVVTVIGVEPLAPSGLVLMYDCIIRGAA